MTRTERLHQSGIIRLGSPKSGFRYKHSDGRKVNAADLKRIQALAIPPAWTDVAINAFAGVSFVIAILPASRDILADRLQLAPRAQELKKFKRVIKFAESIPKLRATVSRHLRQPGLGRERVLATIVRVLSTCFMRPGSQVYASENGSYGCSDTTSKTCER